MGIWRRVAVAVLAMLVLLGTSIDPATAALPGDVNFAGYSVVPPAGAAQLQATLVVPTVSCEGITTNGTALAFRVSFNQNDDGAPTATLFAGCDNSTPRNPGYSVGVQVPGQGSSMFVAAGDRLLLRAYNDPNPDAPHQRASVVDLTTGASIELHGSRWVIPNESASIGIPRNLPILNFGKVEWVKATMNGAPFGSFGPKGTNLVHNDDGSKLLVWTSALSPSGSSFRNVWIRAS